MQNQTQTEEPPWTILSILKWTTSYFTSHNIENPRASAEVLLAHVLGVKRIDLYIRYDQPLIPDELSRFKTAIRRRMRREPVAYVTGEKESALGLLSPPAGAAERPGPATRILELGTGSGAVILALASELKTAVMMASDRSKKAIGVARRNARRFDLDRRVHFFCGDWFACMRPRMWRFDMILSNPPYIPTAEIDRLQAEVSRYEPRGALDGGIDGLASIQAIIDRAPDYLRPGGHLLLEIGHDQKADVEKIVALSTSYAQLDFIRDYGGHDRVVKLLRK
jgi:release factor glutamine methyltransferase